jgi:hypothetical protein
MTRNTETDASLDALFAQAREDAPDAALMARVLADGAAVQSAATAPVVPSAPRQGWLAGVVQALGGWAPVGGVTAAGLMGLSMGLYAPEAVAGLIGADSLGLEVISYSVTPDMGALWLEDGDV